MPPKGSISCGCHNNLSALQKRHDLLYDGIIKRKHEGREGGEAMKSGYDLRVPQRQIRIAFSVLMRITVTCGILLTPALMVPSATAQDSKPVAVINGDSHVSLRQTVYLDGTMSSDPKGLGLNYQWTLVSSPERSTAVIADDTNSQAKFEADAVGIFKVKLVVNNGLVDSTPFYYTISVTE
jgi:hypothetical protein